MPEDATTPAAASGPSQIELADKAAKEFQEWWDANIPNSPFSRDRAAYDELYQCRMRMFSALANTKE